MAQPWEKDPVVSANGARISATPLPRNPAVVAQEEEEDRRKDREEGYDRGDRSFDEAEKLRKEYQGQAGVVEYKVALGTFNSARNTKPTAQGDQSLITAYAKMLDPNSVVREGEFAVTASTENVLNQLKARLGKEFGWEEGGMLTPSGRKAVLGEMRNLVVNRFQPAYQRDRTQYEKFAGSYGVDPYKVIGEDAAATFPKDLLDPITVGENSDPAGSGATVSGAKIPQEYQQAHYDYLKANWGKIDAQDYAAFRSRLDERFNLTPNLDAYVGAVAGFNEAANLGVTPGQLGTVPNPPEEMSEFEQGLNSFASSAPGAFLANWGNAGAMGLPAKLSGNQDKLETIRDMNPGASLGGEMAGGLTGAFTLGGGAALAASRGGRAADLLANPITSDIAYNTVYGATQDDNAFRGGALGATSGALGSAAGNAVGRFFPRVFAPDAVRAADNSVPTIPQLQERAGQQYQAAETAGEIAGPDATQGLYDATQALLAREGRITPAGRLIDTDTPVTRAHTLMQDFAGQPMSPTQAGSVRRVLGEGLTAVRDGAPDAQQRRLAGMMVDQFDEWADPVLPGIGEARETASRYLQGQDIARAREMADANDQWFTQSGPENALRRSFRDLDRSTIRGTRRFDDQVTGAIENVSRGNWFSNAARGLGKLAPTSGIPITATLGAGGLASMGGGPGALVAGGLMAVGATGRAVATAEARRAAAVAELMARGGQEYADQLAGAINTAGLRARRIGSGLFGVPTSHYFRDTTN